MKKWLILSTIGLALLAYAFIDIARTEGASIGPQWLIFVPGIVVLLIAITGIYLSRIRSK